MELSAFTPQSELVLPGHPTPLPRFPVINVHTHFGTTYFGDAYPDAYGTAQEVSLLRGQGVHAVVNLDGGQGEQLTAMLAKTQSHADFFHTFGTPNLSAFEAPDFARHIRESLFAMKQAGIKGLKFFKELSLGFLRDAKGGKTALCDMRLSPLWETAGELDLPILIHIADPPAFFKPVDGKNERYDELGKHPDWSFYGQDVFSFAYLMEQQEQLLETYTQTRFIIAHAGSWAENLAWVSRCMARNTNMYVDIAARISELGRQPYSAADWFARFSSRILFGTDGGPGNRSYPVYYRFLETRDEYFAYSDTAVPRQGRWQIYGLGLPDDILRKVYYENAAELLRLPWEEMK